MKRQNSLYVIQEVNYKENGVINQSLFVLKECIRSLVANKLHVPFRGSELTKMLKHSFDSSCKTFILATLSQEESNSGTSVDVLNYISDIKNIKTLHTKYSLPPVNIKNNKNEVILGSPRFQLLYGNKHILKNFQHMENKLLNEMIQKKIYRKSF